MFQIEREGVGGWGERDRENVSFYISMQFIFLNVFTDRILHAMDISFKQKMRAEQINAIKLSLY